VPIYDYLCGACGHRLEVIHGVHEDGPRFCPACGAEGRMQKAISAPAIVYKGGGWAKKDRRATKTPGSSKTSDSSGGSTEKSPADGGSSTSSPASSAKGEGSGGSSSTPASSSSSSD
jgi:putative FmdB family regulatory protein